MCEHSTPAHQCDGRAAGQHAPVRTAALAGRGGPR
jgi:hypothetical protein